MSLYLVTTYTVVMRDFACLGRNPNGNWNHENGQSSYHSSKTYKYTTASRPSVS